MSMVSKTHKARDWSPAIQETSLKSDRDNQMAAGVKNPFGDKDLGDVLNEIADPTWVDPKKAIRAPKQNLDKDAFFKLMLTQMKHQDPTNPMQSHEMAAQLAQFTSLEQLFNINEGIEGLKKGQTPMADYQVLNFIGKSIAGDSSKIVRGKGDKTHELRFNLGADAQTAEIQVKDADGNTVKKFSVNQLKKGSNTYTWNGHNEESQAVRAGDYTFVVEAKADNGKKLAVNTEVKGRITGVNYTSKGPVLLVGEQSIYLSDVKKIEDADLKQNEAAKTQSNSLQMIQKPKAAEEVEGAPDESTGRGNMNSVAMTGNIKNMVDKANGQ